MSGDWFAAAVPVAELAARLRAAADDGSAFYTAFVTKSDLSAAARQLEALAACRSDTPAPPAATDTPAPPAATDTVLVLSDAGLPLLQVWGDIAMPADYSFDCINNYVHCEAPHYEDLQNLALGMASHIETLRRRLAAGAV